MANESCVELEWNDIEDNMEWELGRLFQIFDYVKEVLKRKKPITILEIGIGFALVTTGLSSYFKSKEIILHAYEHPGRTYLKDKNYIDHLEKTRVKLELINIVKEKWPHGASMVDVVIFSETLEHIPPTQLPFVLAEISRVLKPNGILICTSPNLGYWRVRWKMMRGKSPFDSALPLDWAAGTYAHIRLYTIAEMISICRVFSLEIEHYQYRHFKILYRYGIIPILKKIIYKMCPAMSPEFIFMAKKITTNQETVSQYTKVVIPVKE